MAFLFACNKCLLVLVVLLHASAAIAAAAALDNSTDLASLLAFKAASTTTSGGGGAASDSIIAANWTTDVPFCTWVGVGCSRRRPRVVSLNLSSFSLQGQRWKKGLLKLSSKYFEIQAAITALRNTLGLP